MDRKRTIEALDFTGDAALLAAKFGMPGAIIVHRIVKAVRDAVERHGKSIDDIIADIELPPRHIPKPWDKPSAQRAPEDWDTDAAVPSAKKLRESKE
jgi:hypothetical protein